MIQIIDGFNLQTATPIDSRIVVADEDERLAITSAYPGLRVWQLDTSTPYFWDTLTDPVMPDWKSELDLVVTGSGNTDSIPRFETTGSPSKLIDSQISDDGSKVSIVNKLEVGGDLKVTGELDSDLNADRINDGKLQLEYLDNGGSSGNLLLLDTSGTPTWGDVGNISIGTSDTTSQVKIEPIIDSKEYRIILSDTNDTLTGLSDLALSSYANGLLIKKTTASDVCILSKGGSETNPPYSFYDGVTTTPATPLGGMYYGDDSIGFSIDGVTKLKIKADGVYIKTSSSVTPNANASGSTIGFNNINSIGVPIGGIIMWSGDPVDLGDLDNDGNLWNFRECNGGATPTQCRDTAGDYHDVVWNGDTLPNLSGRFALGSDSTYTYGQEAGSPSTSLTIDETMLPKHNHGSGTLNITSSGSHRHQLYRRGIGTLVGLDEGDMNSNKGNRQPMNIDTMDSASHTHPDTSFAGDTAYAGGNYDSAGNFQSQSPLISDTFPSYYVVTYIIRLV